MSDHAPQEGTDDSTPKKADTRPAQEEQATDPAMDVVDEVEAAAEEVSETKETAEQDRTAEAKADEATDEVNMAEVAAEAVKQADSDEGWIVAGARKKKKKASIDAPRRSDKGGRPKFNADSYANQYLAVLALQKELPDTKMDIRPN